MDKTQKCGENETPNPEVANSLNVNSKGEGTPSNPTKSANEEGTDKEEINDDQRRTKTAEQLISERVKELSERGISTISLSWELYYTSVHRTSDT